MNTTTIMFSKDNVNHVRCVRDVEMEIRFGDKCDTKNDEYNDIRQYVRDVINGKEQNKDITEIYEWLTNLINQV